MSASSASSGGTDSFVPGTELIVDRFAYRHHGIYLGDGLVIHYAGRISYPHGLIETIALRDFVGRRRVRVGRMPAESLRGEDIVRRARSRLGERRYDIFRNNCEHFCSWCQIEESRSKQVDLFLRRIQPVKCAVRNMLLRRCGSDLGRRLRSIVCLKSILAKCLLRLSAADLPCAHGVGIAGGMWRRALGMDMSVGETPAGSPVRGRQSQEWVHRAHRLFRAGIRALLRSGNDIEIVAKAANGREALRLVAAHRPEVVPRGWLVLVATAAR